MVNRNNNKKDFHEEKTLRASDVKERVGLSYRQLNDWDSKGVLPNNRKDKSGWRKFSSREVFMMMVCKEIRDRFGVSLESFNFIRKFMLQKGANHFRYAIEMMQLGISVYLLTDLKETFILDTDLEFEDLFRLGFFRNDEPQSYIFIKVNHLVNRMLEMKGLPKLASSEKLYNQLVESEKERIITNTKEREILKLVRNKNYSKITIQLKNGQIIQASTEEEYADNKDKVSNNEIFKILKSNDFQSVFVQVHDGRIVRFSRRIPVKFDKTAERT